MIPPITVVCQLSLEPIKAPVPSCSSNVGSANALRILYGGGISSGPMARIITVFGPVPCTMNPPIITLSPVCTKPRVLTLPSMASGGVAVGVGVPAGVGVGVGAGVGVRVGAGVGVRVGVGVGVRVGVGVGLSVTTLTVPTMPQQPPCVVQ